jgi:hypothetical protein
VPPSVAPSVPASLDLGRQPAFPSLTLTPAAVSPLGHPLVSCDSPPIPRQGTFDSAACKCQCQNEKINAAGYCRDAEGRCTVQKDYDFAAKDSLCPKPAAAAASPAAAPTAGPAATSATPAQSAAQPVTVEMDVEGATPADFTETRALALCARSCCASPGTPPPPALLSRCRPPPAAACSRCVPPPCLRTSSMVPAASVD